MRRLLLSLAPLLLALVLLPPAVADEDDGGGNGERTAPTEQPAERTATAPDGSEQSVPGRPSSYYQTRPSGETVEGEGEAEAPKPFVMPSESTVLGVRKQHNAPWVGNWLAVELDMGFAVVGQAGKEIGATVTFYEAENHRPLRAAMRPYVDAAGNLSVYTQLVPVKSNSRLFRAKLKVPYRAFPWPTSGPTYGVEARVRLMSRNAAGEFAVLARSATAFTIHYEKGCGCKPPGQVDCSRCQPWQWEFGYTWCKIWGDELGTTPSKVPCLPPPLGPDRRQQWYEALWRTRCSAVGQMEKRLDSGLTANSETNTGSSYRPR